MRTWSRSLLTGVPKISRAGPDRTGCRSATIHRSGSNACASVIFSARPQRSTAAAGGRPALHVPWEIDDERIRAKVASRRRDGRSRTRTSRHSLASGGTRTAMQAGRRLSRGERAGSAEVPCRQLSGAVGRKCPREPASLGQTLNYVFAPSGHTSNGRECAVPQALCRRLSSSPLRTPARRIGRNHCESGTTATSPAAERLLFGSGLWRRVSRCSRAPSSFSWRCRFAACKGGQNVAWFAIGTPDGIEDVARMCGRAERKRGGSLGPARDQAVSLSVGTGFGRPDWRGPLGSD